MSGVPTPALLSIINNAIENVVGFISQFSTIIWWTILLFFVIWFIVQIGVLIYEQITGIADQD